MSQKPDATTAKDGGTTFTPHSEGQHAMVCVDVVNLGLALVEYPGKPVKEVPKAALVFASGERQPEDNSLKLVTVEMTRSMFETSNMRKFLESWRGKSYTPEQAEAGVPLDKLWGKTALVTIEHKVSKRGRKFGNVASITILHKAIPAPDAAVLEEYTRPKFLETRRAEYAAAVAKYREQVGAGGDEEPPPGEAPEGQPDDDLPF